MSATVREEFDQIVLEGTRVPLGMGSFEEWLTEEDSQRVLGYILYRANADRDQAAEEANESGAGTAG